MLTAPKCEHLSLSHTDDEEIEKKNLNQKLTEGQTEESSAAAQISPFRIVLFFLGIKRLYSGWWRILPHRTMTQSTGAASQSVPAGDGSCQVCLDVTGCLN